MALTNNEIQRRYRLRHPDRVSQSQAKWKLNNKEQWNAYMRAWRLAHPGYQAQQDARYRKNNLALRRVKEAHKTRRRRAIPGSFTLQEWEQRKQQFNYVCPGCGTPDAVKSLTIDHIVPTIKGGTNFITNIQPLCSTCNFRKHTKVIEYAPWQA